MLYRRYRSTLIRNVYYLLFVGMFFVEKKTCVDVVNILLLDGRFDTPVVFSKI